MYLLTQSPRRKVARAVAELTSWHWKVAGLVEVDQNLVELYSSAILCVIEGRSDQNGATLPIDRLKDVSAKTDFRREEDRLILELSSSRAYRLMAMMKLWRKKPDFVDPETTVEGLEIWRAIQAIIINAKMSLCGTTLTVELPPIEVILASCQSLEHGVN